MNNIAKDRVALITHTKKVRHKSLRVQRHKTVDIYFLLTSTRSSSYPFWLHNQQDTHV